MSVEPHILSPDLLRGAIVTLAGLLVLLTTAIAIGDERRRRSMIGRQWWKP